MENVAFYITLGFVLTTLLTVWLFYKAAHRSKIALAILAGWLFVQAVMGISGFYLINTGLPPRFALAIGPPLLAIIVLFLTAGGRRMIDKLDLQVLTLLHVIRIPIELILLGLYMAGQIPRIMTFEGNNFDILSGITAPLVYYFAFRKRLLGRKVLLVWNIACMLLLVNIVATAILAAPTPLQRFAFDQPNVAVLHFPFIWLPCCIVPLVLLSHLTAIRFIVRRKKY